MTEEQIKASAIDHYNKGRAKHNLGQYAAAIVYNTAIRLKPDHTLIYYDRAGAKYYLGQYEAAIVDYDIFIWLKPDDTLNALAYWMRGMAKYGLSQYKDAISDIGTFIRLEPDYASESAYASAYRLCGLAKYGLGQYENAIVDYDNAIRLKPDFPFAYYNRGNAKVKLDQNLLAEQDWQIALKLATQAGNVKLKNEIESILRRSTDQVKTSNSTTDQQNAFDQDLEMITEDRQTSLEALQAFEKQSEVRLMQEPLPQNKHPINQLAKEMYLKIPLDEIDHYAGEPWRTVLNHSRLYTLQLMDYALRGRNPELSEWRYRYDKERHANMDWVGQKVYELTYEMNPEAAWNYLLEALNAYDRRDMEDDPVQYATLLVHELILKMWENEEATATGGLEVYTPIPEEHFSGTSTVTSTTSAREKTVHYSEDQIKDIVADYFESLPTTFLGYSIKREYIVQMGSDQRRADVVFLRNGKLVAIAECKRTGRVENGIKQLHSYLCATDTYLGIFANDGDPSKWTFWENHRHNNFVEIDRKTFENYIYNHDKTIKDRENKIKGEVQREIDAEIRERVRKNTNTDAVRQNETERIEREARENIDRTAVMNSVKSQIAQQVENGLLKERDKENRKRGREQGFLLTIFGIIGIGILIALLIASAG